jgi:cyclopropane fatty-acyl-phospholipid synthase-like methyltransferase
MDPSNGYESISQEFISRRSAEIGVTEVRSWAKTLQKGSSVIDLGCGSGLPLTSSLVAEGLDVFGLDASPSLVDAFRKNLPGTPVLCEAVQTSDCFHRSFDATLAWGLIFLLAAEEQHSLIQRFANILNTGGRLLFTSPARAGNWKDAMTSMTSLSLGAEDYRKLLKSVFISVFREYENDGGNHYYDAVKD